MNNFFTQTAVLAYEPFVERTIEVFVTEMDNRFVNKHGIEGNIDFHTWMSYFTFDVISDLTYSKRHGFISRGEDVYGIIGWVADFLSYGFVVSLSLCPYTLALINFSNSLGGSNALGGHIP